MKKLARLTFITFLLFMMIAPVFLLAQDSTAVITTTSTSSDWFTVTWIAGILLAISEALTAIPSIKSNGIFQAIYNGLKFLLGKKNA